MPALKAKRCYRPAASPSRWVHAVYLTCDDDLAVTFNHGQQIVADLGVGPGRYLGVGGAPAVTCLYPSLRGAKARQLFDLAVAWAWAGEWVHRFLYKKVAYKIVAPPAGGSACACAVTVSLASSLNPSASGDSVTFTATVSNNDGVAVPTGEVSFTSSVDGGLGTVSLTGGTAQLTLDTLSIATHTITAAFAAQGDFGAGSDTLDQEVLSAGVSTACCPAAKVPTALTATLSNVSGCPCAVASVPLAYNGSTGHWEGTAAFGSCGRDITLALYCDAGAWKLDVSYSDACVPASTALASSSTCSPFTAAFTRTTGAACGCAGPGDYAITVTV